MSIITMKRSLQTCAAAIFMSAVMPATAFAQDADVDEAGRQDLTLTTITKQPGGVSTQSVAGSVTSLSEQLLQDAGVRSFRDLALLVPGLSISRGQSDAEVTVRLRGVGTIGSNVGLESAVGLFVDGVYRPRGGAVFSDLGDVERVEVAKGAQDTLFGRNSSAGVIHVINRRPTFDTTFSAEATGGNYDGWALAATANVGLSDTAGLRLHGSWRDRDAFGTVNVGSGPRTATGDGDHESWNFRGQLLVQPTESLSINASFDLGRNTSTCCAAVTLVPGIGASVIDVLAVDTGTALTANPFARAAWSNRSTEQKIEDLGGSLQIDWDNGLFGGARLSSITALRRWESTAGSDLDHSTADLLYRDPTEADNYTRFDTFSQELRLSGKSSTIDWLIGASYLREDLDRNEAYRVGSAYEPYLSIDVLRRTNPLLAFSPTAPLFLSQASGRPFGTVFAGHAASDQYRQRSTNFSLFTYNTLHASDAIDLTVGLRYSHDKKELASSYSNPNGGLGCGAMLTNPAQVVAALVARGLSVAQASAAAPNVVGFACAPWTNVRHNGRITSQSNSGGEWAGTVKAAWQLSDQATLYVSAARGYRAGGYNLDRVQTSTGLSSGTGGIVPVDNTWFGRELAETYELGARTTFADGKLLFNVALFRQDYRDVQHPAVNGLGSTLIRTLPKLHSTGVDAEMVYRSGGFSLRGGMTYADTEYGPAVPIDVDLLLLPNAQVSFAPKWSFTGAVGYEWSFGSDLSGRAHLTAKTVSQHATGYDLDPAKLEEGYALVNARIAIGSSDRRWTVEAWVNNLTQTKYIEESFDPLLQVGAVNGYVGAPRTYGLTLRVGF